MPANGNVFIVERETLKSYIGPGGEVTVPNGINCIGHRAFALCEHVTSVILPDSVTIISDNAFRGSGITSVRLSKNLRVVADYAFAETPLTHIEFPDCVEKIEEMAFFGAQQLKTAILPKAIYKIAPGLFLYCSSLEQIDIPQDVIHIEGSSFKGCTALKKVNMPKSLETVWTDAFCGCTSLEEVSFGSNLKALGHCAFAGCPSLKQVIFSVEPKQCYSNVFLSDPDVRIEKRAFPKNIFLGNKIGDTVLKIDGDDPFVSSLVEREKAYQKARTDRKLRKVCEAAADEPGITPELYQNIWAHFDRLDREGKIRELTHTLSIDGGNDGIGWASVRIDLDGNWAQFNISYIGPSLNDFRKLVRGIKDGECRGLCWNGEPGWYGWQIQRRSSVLYVTFPRLGRSIFLPREQLLEATEGLTDDW